MTLRVTYFQLLEAKVTVTNCHRVLWLHCLWSRSSPAIIIFYIKTFEGEGTPPSVFSRSYKELGGW